MKKLQIFIFLLLFNIPLFSQIKEIKGDTIYWYKSNIEFQKKLDLKNFKKSSDEFNFRFRNHGQVIEISKNNNEFYGTITNFIYHTKKVKNNKTETLSNKIILPAKQVENIYNIVQNSKILELPSDNNIENWSQGMDGITYIIEHSDKKIYWLKKYWTPSSQDSIPEALIVLDLVKNLSETLNLNEEYASFKNTLPKYGCYNSGGISNMCYLSNFLELGYSGASKLPLGFYSSYSAIYLGKSKINGNTSLQYNFNNDGFHHLNLQLSKWNIFYKNLKITDYISYNYQNRILNIDNTKNKFENHQMKYGLNLKNNLGIGIGLDYLSKNYEKIGGHLFVNKWFSKSNISTTLSASIFESQLNYKTEIFKSINFNNSFLINRIAIGLTYENFINYKDLYFNIRILI
ncbi:hypothetical protein B0A58_01350 [Flavobacterium branchiophilum NBRC 15030 = ATCC 35035]|uniref:Uncharacterized protein n=1 Tax=Flavobacterium branchiophilum TaxID=55197 RepID=A0A543G6A7_9FLAO|nr:hypothetical protein [Flavobacterium branchiophilum]OXA81570.1 hypothetical protein B0A58_01350 [Flavobacterium branchiophilum NBRC 15030 = ATCC 35035]TQM41623.1 hypothetical protein BC670_2610 [Flavobacterium branchiophilum]GEM55300.1 hypothetical protein FB1_15210 [Flavobacterium branchiophilum NBRC 15030 = ATCC 35035]